MGDSAFRVSQRRLQQLVLFLALVSGNAAFLKKVVLRHVDALQRVGCDLRRRNEVVTVCTGRLRRDGVAERRPGIRVTKELVLEEDAGAGTWRTSHLAIEHGSQWARIQAGACVGLSALAGLNSGLRVLHAHGTI